jgi:hypothetical protein
MGNKHCIQCPDLPYQIYFNWRDPSVSEEEHASGLQERVDRLQNTMKTEKRCEVM